MDVQVRGAVPPGPFLSARDLLATEHHLRRPVEVRVREDPDERTWNAHYDDRHVLNISRQAATSAMARELALHEYAHMVRHEQGHPSHTQSTREALYLALAGRSVERHRLVHCYQIANHMKDIYADDITLSVAPADKLVAYLESGLATAIADRPGEPPAGAAAGGDGAAADGDEGVAGGSEVGAGGGERGAGGGERGADGQAGTAGTRRITAASDPDITAVNAAFALALVERHGLVGPDHRIYDLADAAAGEAPSISLARFKRLFGSLSPGPDESEYRKALVEATRAYVLSENRAAD